MKYIRQYQKIDNKVKGKLFYAEQPYEFTFVDDGDSFLLDLKLIHLLTFRKSNHKHFQARYRKIDGKFVDYYLFTNMNNFNGDFKKVFADELIPEIINHKEYIKIEGLL